MQSSTSSSKKSGQNVKTAIAEKKAPAVIKTATKAKPAVAAAAQTTVVKKIAAKPAVAAAAQAPVAKKIAAKPAATAAKAPVAKDKPKLVIFQIQYKPGSKVYVAGDFNAWNHLEHELSDYDNSGIYQLAVELKPGIYEYKFHINDIWCVDPGNPNFNRNPMGTLNSVITIE